MIHQDATVREKTVEAAVVAYNELSAPPPRRKRAPRRQPQHDVATTRVHPLAMAAARRILASGSYTRLEVVSATEVWVR